MSEQYQRVKPTPFDAPTESPQIAAAGKPQRPPWLLPALAVLALLAVVVIFLLPGWIDNSDRDRSGTPAETPTETDSSSGSPRPAASASAADDRADAASPFADALAAKVRAEAQDLLAELLDVQENLTERGAEDWAADAMAAIAAEALSGDERYREREFEAAIGHYEKALSDALALEQSIPERFQNQLDLTRDAVEALDVDAATAALEMAALLEPGAPESRVLAERVASLPEVAKAYAAGLAAEEKGDLQTAVARLDSAFELDSAHERVQRERTRLRGALTEARFNAAMSEGYAALDAAEFPEAEARFKAAEKLLPGSSEAAAALQELAVARTVATLNRLQARGEQLLVEESWESAIKTFEEALAIDPSLRFAREGLAFARPRATATTELSAILDSPERLVDDAILSEARDALARARALADPGPKLSEQIERAADVLAVASKPLPVTLVSDGLTEVTVYKVARLGSFDRRQLTLRPGSYTAVGSRRGFRDVRVEFKVGPDRRGPVSIVCSEPI